jgi:phenylacetate-CoA ligase
VACECAAGGPGLHGWEDHFLFELVDPDSGEPVDDGPGELVITTLTKEAMPLIRYRTGDITSLTGEPCACGRTHVRLARVSGRADDMLIIRGVNLFPSQVEALLVGEPDIAPHYQLVVRREGALDTLTVEVETERDLDADEAAAVAARVVHRVKSMAGIACEAAVRTPGSLPRSAGKAVRVRDLR